MSAGQWEVVKSKKTLNGKLKTPKDDVQKSGKNELKLDDNLPTSQIKSFNAGSESDDAKKQGKKNAGDKKNKKPNSDKKNEHSKAKPPKTIEVAAELIDVTELANIIATNKVRFTNAPLVWLKEIANYLNSKILIELDDPTLSQYEPSYPISILPQEIKGLLKSIIQDSGKANAQLFFDVTLTAVANDMSRGQSVNGHRLFLQLLAQEYPEFCVASIQKSVSLRNSYQNRPPIGLTLLWAVGQGGFKDFSTGLQAWQELFLPIIELKNYTKYIISYLSKMLDSHLESDAVKLPHEKYLALIDAVNLKQKSLSKDQSNDLMKQIFKIKDIFFARNTNKFQVTFNQLMKRLPNQFITRSTVDPLNSVILESLVDCLAKDDSCNAIWRQLFHKCSKQSASLLDYIDTNWDTISTKLKQKSLKVTVSEYQDICGETLQGKKKDETVSKANKICQDILGRMTTRSTRRFPWFWASFFLFISIIGLVVYDTSRVGGDFPKSATGKFLNDLGVLEQSQLAWRKGLSSSARGYIWLENNVPVYYSKSVEVATPYAVLAKDVAIVVGNKVSLLYGNVKTYVIETSPVVVSKIDEFAPGLVDTVASYTSKGWTAVRQFTVNSYHVTSEYLSTKVFVGEWAPEVLHQKTQSALNATRDHVSNYYSWLRGQVNVYSEIP